MEKKELQEIKICPRCLDPVKQLFYNYRKNPICKKCLNLVLKESSKTITTARGANND